MRISRNVYRTKLIEFEKCGNNIYTHRQTRVYFSSTCFVQLENSHTFQYVSHFNFLRHTLKYTLDSKSIDKISFMTFTTQYASASKVMLAQNLTEFANM